MVEKPAKVAALMAQWLVNGWCRETIFNPQTADEKTLRRSVTQSGVYSGTA